MMTKTIPIHTSNLNGSRALLAGMSTLTLMQSTRGAVMLVMGRSIDNESQKDKRKSELDGHIDRAILDLKCEIGVPVSPVDKLKTLMMIEAGLIWAYEGNVQGALKRESLVSYKKALGIDEASFQKHFTLDDIGEIDKVEAVVGGTVFKVAEMAAAGKHADTPFE